jgi:DNA-binding response OmpR family regulator
MISHDYIDQNTGKDSRTRSNPILLIEDSSILIRCLTAVLKGHGCSVISAQKLAEGLDRLKTENVCLVLLDLSLPDSTGLDTFIKVRSQAPDVPIVVLTGLDSEKLALETMRCGAKDYLLKGQHHSESLAHWVQYAVARIEMKLNANQLAAEPPGN